ncbi:MAG: hypothetical protein WCV58_00390 [Patescibacteria group bacterium]
MKKIISALSILAGIIIFYPASAFAASNSEVAHFADQSLEGIIIVASVAAVFFLIRGGYIYITSTGNPAALQEAKSTIKKALIGLVIILAAGVLTSILSSSFTEPSPGTSTTAISLSPIQPDEADGSLAQLLLNAVSGFLKNIVQSATKPIMDGIMGFLTNTPTLATNSVVFNFWLIIVGITDSLYVLVIALLGFHVMSASSFGFEELSLKELLPKIGLSFLLANTSIFLIDWFIKLCQVLIHAVLGATGGLGQAWILNAFDPAALLSGTTALITLIFLVIFIVLAVVLLLFYISRLMILAFGAVISPILCLLWLIPKATGFAESAAKAYLVMIFTLFVHVVLIQLASAFLTIPGQEGSNPFIAALVGIALFSVLLKSSSTMIQLVLTSQNSGMFRKFGSQILNVLSPGGNTVSKVATHQTIKQTARVK